MFLTFEVPLLSFFAKCLLPDTNSFEGETLIIRRGTFASKFATNASKFIAPVANCSEQTPNQNTNIALENWKPRSYLFLRGRSLNFCRNGV